MMRKSLITTVLLMLQACTTLGTTEATRDITYHLTTTSDINQDIHGEATPIVVHVYQLTAEHVFNRSSYETLIFNQKGSSLGNDVLSVDEYLIMPGTTKMLDMTIDQRTRYIGIAAAYNNPDDVTWRTIVTITKDSLFSDTNINIQLNKLGVNALTQ